MTHPWIYFWILFLIHVTDIECDNSPPVLRVDRQWVVEDTADIGTIVTRVNADDGENDPLIFGLEPHIPAGDLPFRIDNRTGYVYTNRSLLDLGGQSLYLYVYVSDGELQPKTEVRVNIVNSSHSFSNDVNNVDRRQRPPSLFPPGLSGTPSFNQPKPPPAFTPPGYFVPPVNKNLPVELSTLVNPPVITPDNKHNIKLNTTSSAPPTSIKTAEQANSTNADITETVLTSASNLEITVIPIASVCAVLLFGCGILWIFKRRLYQSRLKPNKDSLEKHISNGRAIIEDHIALQNWRGPRAYSNRYEGSDHDETAQQVSNSCPQGKPPDRWEFPRHRLKVFNILGEGCFGQVWRCEALDIDGHNGPVVVAVKTLKENASEKERTDLIQELQVMKMLEPHPNVVRLLGCCTEKDPIFVIMEYVANGKLQTFLRNSRLERFYGNLHGTSNNLTSRELTTFVYQVAKGMDYLSSKGIIHRDLAARNILLSADRVCKVADFGFARDVIANHIYERKSEGRLPIRWMAPESLYDNIFSVRSDVWSFGILVWEVVTLGSTPYPGLAAAEVMRKIKEGFRLDKPEHCRRELYNIMYYCWHEDPKERPSFRELMTLLESLLLSETEYIELERFPDHSYYNMVSLSGEKL